MEERGGVIYLQILLLVFGHNAFVIPIIQHMITKISITVPPYGLNNAANSKINNNKKIEQQQQPIM